MKKLLLALFCAITTLSFSQSDLEKALPLDPKIRYGTLPNGMKYYVRYNSKPEKRAELRLAVNAGSTMEDDDQQGLAHFCEHMCFNGTKNYKKSELVDFLESVGTKFGAHLNAYTSFDETVYMLQLRTDVDTILNKGMQVLEDWAHNVSFDDAEIDKERGVVIEEWRLGQGAQERMRRKYWPTLFADSRYAERLPIGKKEILEKAPYETFRKFYKDWYRTDLMAVIAVGDFDVDMMEKKIKQQFGAIPKTENPRPVKVWQVPDHEDFKITTAQDKEAQFTMIQLLYKHPIHPAGVAKTNNDYRKYIIEQLYNGMIGSRLSELQKQADPPFLFASTNYSNFVRNKNVYASFAVVKQDGTERAITTLVNENERVKQFGFTAGELERQKKELMRNIEKALNEKDKTESRNYVQEYVSNFLENEPAPGIEYEFQLYKNYLEGITLADVNSLAKKWITDGGKNAVLLITAPEKEGLVLPADEKLRAVFKEAQTAKITAYVDKASNKPLMEKKPEAGKVVSEKTIDQIGVTEINLSNGVRVFLKPTDFKNDEIIFTAYKMGGTSLYADADYMSADYSNAIVEESGVGSYDKIALDKFMQGKLVNVSPGIGELYESFDGSFSPQDIETAMQMINLYCTAPRSDDVAFKSMMEQQRGFLQNRSSEPNNIFRDTVSYAMSNYHFRSRPMNVDMLQEVNRKRAQEIYNERFSNANGWTFTFVGNFKVDEMKKMLQTYIASLPSLPEKTSFKDIKESAPKGTLDKTVKKGIEPKAGVQLKWTGAFEYNRSKRNEVNALIKLLSIKLRENLREDKGGVYGVGAFPALSKFPQPEYTMTISFGCAPENVEKLISASLDEINDIKANGCNEKNLIKVKETFLREREVYLKENSFWMQVISQSALNNENVLEVLDYNKWVESLKGADFKTWANQYFNMDEYKRFVLLPEK